MKSHKLVSQMNARTRKEKEVWEACEYLKSKSKKLTYYAIGEQLVNAGYKRGSNSDIRRYLTTWKQYRAPNTLSSSKKAPQKTIEEHEPAQTKPIRHFDKTQEELTRQIIDVSFHYAKQFDRLLKSNEFLRKENKLLRKKLQLLEEET